MCKGAHEELCETLGENVEEIELSPSFGHVLDHHKIIMEADLAYSFAHDYETGKRPKFKRFLTYYRLNVG